MLSRLKSLDLQGYKTFANRTVFEFAGAITAIVGPNGSGKSNIADSIRWVLGEQSFHLLRGKRTEDMIFSGSEQRTRAGMASATITFDNQDNWLPIDFSEVAITRRAYRDGTNEYLINGQRVRLKDVSELLAQSGLAERTYTIIGQGLVDAALALKAEDRRRLFEEAAGIGLYRARREEALRRLDATHRNLERVEDILAELEPRLRSLERQARRAQEYDQVKADLRLLLRDWYGYHWHRDQREWSEAREAVRGLESVLERERSKLEKLDGQITGLRERLQVLRVDLNQWHRQLSLQHNQREAASRELAVASERVISLESQQESLQDELARLDGEIELSQAQFIASQHEQERLEAERDEAQQQAAGARQALQERLEERRKAEDEIQSARQRLGALNARQGELQAVLGEREALVTRSRLNLESTSQAIDKSAAALQAARQRHQEAQQNLIEASQAAVESEEALAKHAARQEALHADRRSLADELSNQNAQLARVKAQQQVLEQAEAALTGYADGVRRLLTASRQSELKGVKGALIQNLQVPVELEAAITSAMGEFFDAVLLETDALQALAMLAQGGTRGVLLPLSELQIASRMDPLASGMIDAADPDWVGVAADLIAAPESLRPALEILLGRAWVLRDRQACLDKLEQVRRLPPENSINLRLVSLSGEIFYANGPVISAGKSDGVPAIDGRGSLLARQRQQVELEALHRQSDEAVQALGLRIADLTQTQKELEIEARRLIQQKNTAKLAQEKAASDVMRLQSELEQARRQSDWQIEQREHLSAEINRLETELDLAKREIKTLGEQINDARDSLRQRSAVLAGLELDELQSDLAHWNTRLAVVERGLSDAAKRQQERQLIVQKNHQLREGVEKRIAELESNRQTLEQGKAGFRQAESELTQKIEELNRQIEPAEQQLDELEKQHEALSGAETEARQGVSLADHRVSQARITLVRRQEGLASLQRHIEEDFGLVAFEFAEQVSGQAPLPFDGMVEQLPRLTELGADIEEGIRRQRAQLRRIGPVNPEAQLEYKEVKERHAFLVDQLADLHKAEADVREVIHELDGLMQRDFRKTFDAVASEFKTIFTRLFGGGTARLLLTDPEDLTESGIDIDARLPGRRTQGLSLLSGGERSLTAVALVFALLRVSPTPFCVLDEVDAMLDEANVGRFRELLRELSEQTQFVVVTHNRNTVQAAEIIYGVTMGHDSVSQVLSLKLDEVSKIVD